MLIILIIFYITSLYVLLTGGLLLWTTFIQFFPPPPAPNLNSFTVTFFVSSGEGNSYPLQYSGLENSMDCIVHGVAKSWTQLSNFHFTFLC